MTTTLLTGLLAALLAGCDDKSPDDSTPPDDSATTDTTDTTPDSGTTAPDTGDEFHDPLSTPEFATHDIADFNSAEDCATCHQTHYEQWSTSIHSYAMIDPVFKALVALRQADFNGEQDQFCTQCHTPIGTRGGEITDGFDFDQLAPISGEGVTCETCHKIASIERPYNAGHVLDPTGPLRGPLTDPVDNAYHASEYSEIFDSAEFCGSCHDVVEVDGLNLERPYEEWLESPAGEEGRNCQSCHMDSWDGQAADGGPERTGLHDHSFRGVDVPLSEDFIADPEVLIELEEKVADLLDQAGSVYLEVPAGAAAPGQQMDLLVTLQNNIDGHNLPTGTTFIRQLWVEVIATDAEGTVLYQTGHLDTNGDLMDYWSEEDPYGDDDLLVLHSSLIDDRGTPTVFTWHASEMRSNALSPLYQRTFTLFVPVPEDAVGPIQLQARMRFRSHPPYLLRLVGLDELVERLTIHDIDVDVLEVELLGAGE